MSLAKIEVVRLILQSLFFGRMGSVLTREFFAYQLVSSILAQVRIGQLGIDLLIACELARVSGGVRLSVGDGLPVVRFRFVFFFLRGRFPLLRRFTIVLLSRRCRLRNCLLILLL